MTTPKQRLFVMLLVGALNALIACGHGRSQLGERGLRRREVTQPLKPNPEIVFANAPPPSVEAPTTTRTSTGIDADRAVPTELRGLVRGAYVEGIVNNHSDRAGAKSSGAVSASNPSAGVLLELELEYHLVWATQYGPGPRWSVDLDWRP